jgi:hypothetical protein
LSSAVVLALALVPALRGQDPKPAPDALSTLEARAPIAGLAGIRSTSTLTYAEAPERPHELESTYLFPDRGRWQVVDESARSGRQIVYRAGREFFVLEPASTRSIRIDPQEHSVDWSANLRAFELRRALLLWPDGFAWSGEGAVRSAKIECGSLEATLGSDGRPERIAIQAPDVPAEGYAAIRWSEQRGRWWPSSMEFVLDGARVWSETVRSVDTQVHLLDLYFVPPDRRPAPLAQSAMLRQVIHGDVPSGLRKRVALASGASWPDVEKRWPVEVSAARAAGLDVEPGAWIELDTEGRPIALVLHVLDGGARTRGKGDPPAGTELAAEQPAVLAGLNGVDVDLGEALRTLRGSVPEGTLAGEAYARFAQAPGTQRPVRVYLTVRAKD